MANPTCVLSTLRYSKALWRHDANHTQKQVALNQCPCQYLGHVVLLVVRKVRLIWVFCAKFMNTNENKYGFLGALNAQLVRKMVRCYCLVPEFIENENAWRFNMDAMTWMSW